MGEWAFGDLDPLAYDLLIADPPTPFDLWSDKGNAKSAQSHYSTMTWDELNTLPVSNLGRGDAHLLLWACWPTLGQSMKMLEMWGFRYVTGGAWHKKTVHGKTHFGTGYVLRSSCEPFLLGTLGRPPSSRRVRNLIEAQVRGHSRKPDDQYELMTNLNPASERRCELFARQSYPGWEVWGNETNKFEVEVA